MFLFYLSLYQNVIINLAGILLICKNEKTVRWPNWNLVKAKEVVRIAIGFIALKFHSFDKQNLITWIVLVKVFSWLINTVHTDLRWWQRHSKQLLYFYWLTFLNMLLLIDNEIAMRTAVRISWFYSWSSLSMIRLMSPEPRLREKRCYFIVFLRLEYRASHSPVHLRRLRLNSSTNGRDRCSTLTQLTGSFSSIQSNHLWGVRWTRPLDEPQVNSCRAAAAE